MRRLLVTMLLLAAPACLAAEPAAPVTPGELKPGPGLDVVVAACSGCHSLDYVQMNSPFLTRDGWQAEVTKMRQAYGAPLDQPSADTIVQYLAATYAAAGT